MYVYNIFGINFFQGANLCIIASLINWFRLHDTFYYCIYPLRWRIYRIISRCMVNQRFRYWEAANSGRYGCFIPVVWYPDLRALISRDVFELHGRDIEPKASYLEVKLFSVNHDRVWYLLLTRKIREVSSAKRTKNGWRLVKPLSIAW